MMNRRRKISCMTVIVVMMLGFQQAIGQENDPCANPYACIGMVIDSGDPVLIQMGHEMSDMVTDKKAGTMVKPTAGPIANVGRLLSRENAGLSVVPSDMLQFTERSEDPRLGKAKDRLRFIMTIGRKVVHVIAKTSIRSLEDLDGKRVVMGPDNTALWVVSNNLLHLHGVTPSERLQLKPVAGITAVLLDQADAAFVVGDAPMGVIEKLGAMRQSDALGADTEDVHMLGLKLPATATEYQPATVNYPGFADNLDTPSFRLWSVTISPTNRRPIFDVVAANWQKSARRCAADWRNCALPVISNGVPRHGRWKPGIGRKMRAFLAPPKSRCRAILS